MQLFLMIAAALLISAYSAPTPTESPLNSEEEKVTTESEEDQTADFWLPNPLQNVTKIKLPEEDKRILCDFLATFRNIKMQLFGDIFIANMIFMKNVENKFQKDFKEYQEKHPHNDSKIQLQEFVGVGVSPFKIYREDSAYKQKFYQDLGKVFEKTNEHFIKESQKIKSNLSRETVESEEEFFEKLKAFEEPSTNKDYNDKSDLINAIERKFKYRYQCQEEE